MDPGGTEGSVYPAAGGRRPDHAEPQRYLDDTVPAFGDSAAADGAPGFRGRPVRMAAGRNGQRILNRKIQKSAPANLQGLLSINCRQFPSTSDFPEGRLCRSIFAAPGFTDFHERLRRPLAGHERVPVTNSRDLSSASHLRYSVHFLVSGYIITHIITLVNTFLTIL